RMAMIAITTSNSMRVKPRVLCIPGALQGQIHLPTHYCSVGIRFPLQARLADTRMTLSGDRCVRGVHPPSCSQIILLCASREDDTPSDKREHSPWSAGAPRGGLPVSTSMRRPAATGPRRRSNCDEEADRREAERELVQDQWL